MLFVAALTIALMIGCLVLLWPQTRQTAAGGGAERPAGSEPGPVPESLEGVLVRQILSGEITRRQYARAMAGLAARDAVRHPLEVPPDAVPPES